MNLCGQLQVLQDMGLPTGVELKTAEPVKSEEAEVAVTVEELKPVVKLETATAATGAANADNTDAVEVQSCSLCQQVTIMRRWSFFALILLTVSFLSDCSPTGTNPD